MYKGKLYRKTVSFKPTQKEAVLIMAELLEEKEEKKEIRKAFDFSMIGLNVGDTVIFDALNLPVKVAGKNKVEYEGRLWSLSAFCGTYLPEEMHNKSESYQGPKYFSHNGKTLWEIRLEREKE